VSDELYQNFLVFIEEQGFSYETRSEQMLKELQKAAEKETYYEALKTEILRLKDLIKNEKALDHETYRSDVEQMLLEEIVARYYYQEGRVLVSLDADPDVNKALGVLSDQPAYETILAAGR